MENESVSGKLVRQERDCLRCVRDTRSTLRASTTKRKARIGANWRGWAQREGAHLLFSGNRGDSVKDLGPSSGLPRIGPPDRSERGLPPSPKSSRLDERLLVVFRGGL